MMSYLQKLVASARQNSMTKTGKGKGIYSECYVIAIFGQTKCGLRSAGLDFNPQSAIPNPQSSGVPKHQKRASQLAKKSKFLRVSQNRDTANKPVTGMQRIKTITSPIILVINMPSASARELGSVDIFIRLDKVRVGLVLAPPCSFLFVLFGGKRKNVNHRTRRTRRNKTNESPDFRRKSSNVNTTSTKHKNADGFRFRSVGIFISIFFVLHLKQLKFRFVHRLL